MTLEEYMKLFHDLQLNLVAFNPLLQCNEEVLKLVNAAIAAEREACAKVCEELEYDGYEMLPRAPRMARLIRARGSNESNS